MAHNLKSIRQTFRENGVFYTDERLAQIMKGYVGREVAEVYDPTCGDGALLAVFGDEVRKYGQEREGDQLDVARARLVNFEGVCGDTLQEPAFVGRRFDCIMANPPFSAKWEQKSTDERFTDAPALAPPSKADYAFLLHVLHYLAPDGVAVVLNAPGILYRGNAEGKIRRWLVEQNVIDRVVFIPGGYFVDTKIPTVLLVLRKDRTARGITTIAYEDRSSGREISITPEEIAANDYCLSNLMPQEEKEQPPPIDPNALEQEAERAAVDVLRAHLGFTQAVSELEGIDHLTPFVARVDALLSEYRKGHARLASAVCIGCMHRLSIRSVSIQQITQPYANNQIPRPLHRRRLNRLRRRVAVRHRVLHRSTRHPPRRRITALH
nr:MAG TPA: N-6 DNA Methylase [Caudoviricetes sp.]